MNAAKHRDLADRTVSRLKSLGLCVPPAKWDGEAFVIAVEEYDTCEDGDGSRYLGDVTISAAGAFQIDPSVQSAIDRAKRK